MRDLFVAVVLLVIVTSGLPVPGAAAQSESERCFEATGHCIEGRFRTFWEQNGGLLVFGLPITPAREERNSDTGQSYLTQWFERNRFEFHPENPRPYDVLLGRLGDDRLKQQGRDWYALTKGETRHNCLFFAETNHSVCNQKGNLGFRAYWESHGLQDPALNQFQRSLALFGLPLSEPAAETNLAGATVVTQWFERARFEWHPGKQPEFKVLLGLLGNENGSTLSLAPSDNYPTRPRDLTGVQVVEVVDGDAVDVMINGQRTRLRLMGIDAPDTLFPVDPPRCFGAEAKAKASELLQDQLVFVEPDPTQDESDPWDRRLHYVWLPNGRLFNLEMLIEGYAREIVLDLPYRYELSFKRAELESRERGIGLWGPTTCNGDITQPSPP